MGVTVAYFAGDALESSHCRLLSTSLLVTTRMCLQS